MTKQANRILIIITLLSIWGIIASCGGPGGGGGGDTTAPTLDIITPADDSIGLDNNTLTELTLTFSENIIIGTGSILIHDGGGVFDTIATSSLSGGGGLTITVTLNKTLLGLGGYWVEIPATLFHDAANNYFGGISASDTWNFLTAADGTAPERVSTVPISGDPVIESVPSLQITFNEDVQIDAGLISIFNRTTDALLTTINASELEGEGTKIITIPFYPGLIDPNEYYVRYPDGLFEDAAGNDAVGITALNDVAKDTWWFTATSDDARPTVTLSTSVNDPTGDNPFTITITFSEPIDPTTFDETDFNFTSDAAVPDVGVVCDPAPHLYTTDNITWTAEIHPTPATGDEHIGIRIPAGAIADRAGNTNEFDSNPTPNLAIHYMRTFKTTLSTTVTHANNTFILTIFFGEPGVGEAIDPDSFQQSSDITVTNGTFSTPATIDNITWTSTITPTAEGTVTMSMAQGACYNATGISAASNTINVVYDTTPPEFSATGPADDSFVNHARVNYTLSEDLASGTITWTEVGTSLDDFDPHVQNLTLTELDSGVHTDVTLNNPPTLVNGATYSITFAGTDLAGNAAAPVTMNNIGYDTTPPTAEIDYTGSDPTTAATVNFTVTFNEDMTGFDETDILFTGSSTGTLTAVVTGGPQVFDVAVSGMDYGGYVAVTFAADAARDPAGNGNPVPTLTKNSVIWDDGNVTITATIDEAAGQTDPTNVTPINFTVDFSESVKNFDASDIDLSGSTTNATLSPTVTGGPKTYNVAVEVGGADVYGGEVILTFAANAADDLVNNPSRAPTPTDNSVTWNDGISPSAIITQAGGQSDPTNVTPVNFTVDFSEIVTGFDASDIDLSGSTTNATLTPMVTTLDSKTYNVEVAVSGSDIYGGEVILTFAAGAATDLTGNASLDPTLTDNRVVWDDGNNTVTVTIDEAALQNDPTTVTPINFTVDFSEAVSGFDALDIDLSGSTTNATLTPTVTGGPKTYNVAVAVTGTDIYGGEVILAFAAAAAQDLTGNTSEPPLITDNSVVWDDLNSTVTVTISQPLTQTDPTSTSPIHFTVDFSEVVTGFNEADIVLSNSTTNATLTPTVTTLDGKTYDVEVAVTGFGIYGGYVILGFASGAAQDLTLLGHWSDAPTVTDNSVAWDDGNNTLTVSINTAGGQTDPTSATPINFTVDFSEAVTGFEAADILFTNSTAPGAMTATVTGGPKTYNVAVGGITGGGNVYMTFAAAAAQDSSLNDSQAPTITKNVVKYEDGFAPSVDSITSTTQLRTGANPIPITITFSEAVIDLTDSEITVTSGNASVSGTTSVNGYTWTANLTPTTAIHGNTISVTIYANAVWDTDTTPQQNADWGDSFSRTYLTQVGYDASFGLQGGTTNSITLNNVAVASGNSNRVLIVAVHWYKTNGNTSIESVTFNSVGMTLIPGSLITYNNPPSRMQTALYYLNNPDETTGADVVVKFAATDTVSGCKIGAISLYDTHSHSGIPYGAVTTNASASPSATLTSSITTSYANSLVTALAAGNTTSTGISPTSSQTELIESLTAPSAALSTYQTTTAGVQGMDWNFNTSQTYRIQQSLAEIRIAQ